MSIFRKWDYEKDTYMTSCDVRIGEGLKWRSCKNFAVAVVEGGFRDSHDDDSAAIYLCQEHLNQMWDEICNTQQRV